MHGAYEWRPCADKQINRFFKNVVKREKILIKVPSFEKRYGAKKIITQFPIKQIGQLGPLIVNPVDKASVPVARYVMLIIERLIECHHFDQRIIDRAVSQ